MDYQVRQDPTALESTAFMEIGPGPYSGNHWQPGFIFIRDDAFSVAEGVFFKHFPGYDHYEMNEIPRAEGEAISAELRIVASALSETPIRDAIDLLGVSGWIRVDLSAEIDDHRAEIRTMLVQIADAMTSAYKQHDYACVLGM